MLINKKKTSNSLKSYKKGHVTYQVLTQREAFFYLYTAYPSSLNSIFRIAFAFGRLFQRFWKLRMKLNYRFLYQIFFSMARKNIADMSSISILHHFVPSLYYFLKKRICCPLISKEDYWVSWLSTLIVFETDLISPSTRPGESTKVTRGNFFCFEVEISVER